MSSNYKGGLAVGGSALEKSKLQLRRPTPDSDVLASSDDDREHVAPVVRPAPGAYPAVRRPSSGWLQDIQPNRKFSLPSVSFAASQPTTPALELPQQTRPGTSAFPWNTPSFASNSNSRLKEVAPSPTSAYAHDRPLPSPTTLEGDDGIGFLLNQQNPNPLRKAVRSQSYSIGQGDIEHSPVSRFSRQPPSVNLRHRPSKPSLLGESAVGLSQLREDDADEIESSNGSEHGVRLPAGYWEREQKQALLKQAAMENARARNRATSTGSPVSHQHQQQQRRKTTAGLRNSPYGNATEYAIEELEDVEPTMTHPALSLTRRFSEHVSLISHDQEVDIVDSPQKPQWATGNISPAEMDPLGRRHSFAHYGSYNSAMPLSTLSNTQEEEEEYVSPTQTARTPDDSEPFDAAAYFTGYGPASRAINSSAISAAHPDPIVPNTAMSAGNPYAVPYMGSARPPRRLYVVTFKCSRADIYYTYDNTGLEVRCGDLVIVEGDRGCDLGQVTHADLSMEDARKYRNEANDEHFRWLVMFSQYSLAGTQNDSGMLGALARANGFPNPMSRTSMGSQQDQDPIKPKLIKRLAQQHEIMGLREKEGGEAKAKRLGAQKAADHKLPMEILDAEYQADYHKLTYFYYAESYVNFNELVTDLFKQYKVRIWMSAVNPASVVNPAGMSQVPPPSAIGPGAILNSNNTNAPHAVGPGFGSNTRRSNQQHVQARNQGSYNNYDDGFQAFSQQIPNYPTQNPYNMQPWAHDQQMNTPMYDRYRGYYPNVTASGSPMNYGGHYPPSSYSSYGGGYNPTTTTAGYAASRNYTSNTGQSFGLHPTTYGAVPYTGGGQFNAYSAPYTSGPMAGAGGYYGAAGGQRNGSPGAYGGGAPTATAGPPHSTGYDPALLTAMQNMSFGN
ncbi:PSP1 domain-containing protein [Decorospora gaudefroyi]|uniref:PSP1 domain-containing protein n=1 Tax=Decorospora gaudefroyi TaxID=184978 RepID=A0A6A5KDK4_9PLEO|nr:PSP1 domain-containing protein [Decorospora gaudefroyi]